MILLAAASAFYPRKYIRHCSCIAKRPGQSVRYYFTRARDGSQDYRRFTLRFPWGVFSFSLVILSGLSNIRWRVFCCRDNHRLSTNGIPDCVSNDIFQSTKRALNSCDNCCIFFGTILWIRVSFVAKMLDCRMSAYRWRCRRNRHQASRDVASYRRGQTNG